MVSRSLYEEAPRHERERRFRLLARSDSANVALAIARALGIRGPIITVSTACTSSTNALVHARDLVLSGLADIVLTGGVDAIVEEIVAGFHAMGAMSPAPCAPYSTPIGMTIGEGAGFVVLERASHASARGARSHALLLGTGLSQDGWHATAPNPSGAGVARAMTNALADAGVDALAIDWINAHGTGTEANDAAECRGIERCFGERAAHLPVSSTKSYFGHALGACGVLELITTVLALEAQAITPTLNFAGPRGGGPSDPVAEKVPRAAALRTALKSSSGFGGANAALVVGVADSHSALAAAPDEVVLLGCGAVGPFGGVGAHGANDLDALLRADLPAWDRLAPGSARAWAGRVPAFPLARLVRGADPRSMSALTRHLLVACHLALRDAGVTVHGALHERAGLFVGANRIEWEVADQFWGSIRERGFERASPRAFAQLVLNGPAGEVSAKLGLRGPQTVLAGGRGATLAAMSLATAMLGRAATDLIVVASACEVADAALEDHAVAFPAEPADRSAFAVYGHERGTPVLAEGGAAVVLATRRVASALELQPLARVAGSAGAASGELAQALSDALARAGWADVDAVYGTADGGVRDGAAELSALASVLGSDRIPCNPAPLVGASASIDAVALVAAAEALRRGRAHDGRPARRLVVIGDDRHTGAWAVALEGLR